MILNRKVSPNVQYRFDSNIENDNLGYVVRTPIDNDIHPNLLLNNCY